MVEAPERIWAERDPETNEKRWYSIKGMGLHEYVRADRIEALERDLKQAREMFDDCALQHNEQMQRAEAAEAREARLSEALREYESPTNWGVNGRFDANSSRFDGTSFAHGVLAALSGSGSGGWRTMDSAPKDGTIIDLFCGDERWADCYWGKPIHSCGEYGQYCDSDWHRDPEGWVWGTMNELLPCDDPPSAWMPLPAAPQPTGGE